MGKLRKGAGGERAKRELPTQAELRRLPRWARVVYAARCAQRVQPLFLTSWPGAPQEHVEAVSKAIELSLDAARHPARANAYALKQAARRADEAAISFMIGWSHDSFVPGRQGDAQSVAQAAAEAARAAHAAATSPTPGAALRSAVAAAEKGQLGLGDRAFFAEPLRDFEMMETLAEAERWKDTTPVDAGRLGALWPFGEPEGWPKAVTPEAARSDADEANQPEELPPLAGPVRVYVDPTLYSVDDAARIMSVLSALYQLQTGDRLMIDNTGSATAPVLEPVGAGGGGR